jgi:Transposase IS66 family
VSGRIQEVACWAHVRRKFYELQQAHASPIATEAIERIGQLYAIESEIRGRPPEERRQSAAGTSPSCAGFAGSDAGGERAAAIYSLIGSAKLNGLQEKRAALLALVRGDRRNRP